MSSNEEYEISEYDEDLEDDRRAKLNLARQQELNDIRTVMRSQAGRRLVGRLLKHTHPLKLSYGSKGFDFLEGQRSVGLFLINDLTEADPSTRLLLKALKQTEEEI